MMHPMTEPVEANLAPGPRLNRRATLFLAVAAAAGVGGATLAWWRHAVPQAQQAVDAALWQRKFATHDGAQLAMEVFRGKPLVLNFWATWCPPCIEEMPLLDRFFRENSSKGWQVLGLAIDKPSSVRQFLGANPIAYPVALAGPGGSELLQNLGNISGGLPFTVVIGSGGVLIQRKLGRLSTGDLAAWTSLEGSA